MIRKFQYGNPIQTDAVIMDMPIDQGALPFFELEIKDGISFTYHMPKDCVVYGLGEAIRGINKRGWIYESNCSDDFRHEEHKRSLYGAHNFLICSDANKKFGIFIDYPGLLQFDIGYTDADIMTINAKKADLFVYIIEAETEKDIVKKFREIIGRSYIAPKWGMGYGQSRWSYMNEDEIREVVSEYRKEKMPIDAVYLDIDYMERYKDFTTNNETFPDFADFVHEMKEEGIHLVPIIDAGVKIEEGYQVYEEGVEKAYFCKEEDGTDFVAAVWPGKSHFPDFLNPEVREWFGNHYSSLTKQGIDGFWNDMNEPAIFYSEKHLKEVFDRVKEFENQDMDLKTYNEFMNLFYTMSNNPEDYKRFYHNVNGQKIRHDKVHNLYGYNMTRAAGEAFERNNKEKRILMFSRSSYVGMHRYGGIWTGDNCSWWSHILLNLKMMPSLNMVGILYTGADLGGFGVDCTEDLMLRWLALGIFTPLMRNHSAEGTRRQELYRFPNKKVFKNILDIRYSLMPYLYSEYMKSSIRNEMYFRPLAFDYAQDPFAVQVEDQLMLGDSMMIAPVYTQNATGRYVYLPEKMKCIHMKKWNEYKEVIMEKGHHYIEVPLDEIVFFIRPDKIVPMGEPAECIEKLDCSNLHYLSYVVNQAEYELYNDDGLSKDYENPENYSIIKLS